MRSHQVLASLALWLTIPLTAAAQERIYYTIGNQIRMSIRGSNTSEILITQGQPTGESPRPAFVAVHDNQLYWTSFYPGNIYRSGLRGENPTQLTRNTDDVTFRAIRFRDNKIYWSNEDDGGIYRANMDGTNVETVISPYLGHGFGIFDFQIYGERFYWTSWNSPSISTTRLDGSDYRRISPAGISRAFALEVLNDRIYIADERTGPQTGRIVSTALDGSDLQTLVEGPYVYSLDHYAGRLFYNDENNFSIWSIPLTGGPPRVELLDTGGYSWQLAVIPEPGLAVVLVVSAMVVSRRKR
jgi:hypothetical protein